MTTHLHLKVRPSQILDDTQGGATQATPISKGHREFGGLFYLVELD